MFAMGPAFFGSSGPALLALTGTFANATIGVPYSSSIPISGGLEPYTLTGGTGVTAGALDSGFSLAVTGTAGARFLTLSCASPPTVHTMSFTASVDSSDGQTATSAQSIAVSAGLYSSDGSTLAGWTNSGGGTVPAVDATVGNPAPSLKISSGSVTYRNVPGATRWKFDMRTPSVCDVQLMCSSAGVGIYFRLETRGTFNCGIAVANSWGVFPAAPTGASSFSTRTANTWYTYEIVYHSAARTIDVLENGVTVLSGVTVPYPFNGDYISLDGDGIGPSSNFDNIFIS